jgi:hypothetical protein
MIPLRFGDVSVEIHNGYTVTRFPNGKELHAAHAPQPGQEKTALELGYGDDIEAMNRDHDMLHSMLCYMLGLKCSVTLRNVAMKLPTEDVQFHEEEAVLAVQRFAKLMGIDLMLIARRLTAQQES